MKIISHTDPNYTEFCQTLDRRAIPDTSVSAAVSEIIGEVRERGTEAILDFTRKFDSVELTAETIRVSEAELAEADASVTPELRAAVAATRENIHSYAQHSFKKAWTAENAQGAVYGERFHPYDRVGVYVPGGKAPLVSTALMTAAFAQAAGVEEIVAVTPAGGPNKKVNPSLLYALKQAGATEVYQVGGAHAVAMLALGTAEVPPVQKIFGPGNPFVVEAKRQLIGAVSIDLLPGPSEVLVVADDSANPRFVAADLLAQAEHGGDSVIAFFTPSLSLVEAVQEEIKLQAAKLSRGAEISRVLDEGTSVVITKDLDEAIKLSNDFAAEHLTLIVEDEEAALAKVRTSGAVYVGNFSPVAVGDFLAGPSHTLPTGGSAKSFSGLRADQFQRRMSIVRMDRSAVEESVAHTDAFAAVEGLDAHGRSVQIRLED